MAEFFEKVDPILYYLGLSSIVKYALIYTWKDKKPVDVIDQLSMVNYNIVQCIFESVCRPSIDKTVRSRSMEC